ncbi:hypothetical protein VLK81_05800 [Citroniella saccharovorans]|uniref:ATP-binding protein n=1 Tax=Citroniella saccharovorans TaxID=2053367 RepID=A0AAW9MY08_9FIRM|nr:hypothetical protein [Citroniella saccharovorans]MEB3429527.1 hypothetical protein [Citroniella saccharovorans]
MIKFVLGPKGSGKTKWLIDGANLDKKEGHGNIVFVDTDDSHIFSLDHSVRLVNANDFGISTPDEFYAFLCGIVSRDFDIEKIYVDGIYEILEFTNEELSRFEERLLGISEKYEVTFLIGLNKSSEELKGVIKGTPVELEA